MINRKLTSCMALLFYALLVGCYSFTGSSIPADIKTIWIGSFPNRATLVNPTLSSDFTDGLRSYILSRARFNEVDMESADIAIDGEITAYDITAIAIQSDATAALNKLSVSIKINFVNNKYPKDGFSQTFTRYQEFPSSQDISVVESDLVSQIIKEITEDVYNRAFSNW
ncbi:hypothetical protein FACS1894201_00680 [Bacteroidia bacterium]|nr:hypothetical protein FACS1894201_00680 [Bacteroidia bacterium]